MCDAQVATWLRAAGLSRFSARFAGANVGTSRFLSLAPRELDSLGVDGPADRKRLADLIADIRRGRGMPPLVPENSSPNGSGNGAGPATGPSTALSSSATRGRRSARLDDSDVGADSSSPGGPSTLQQNVEVASVRVCVRKRPLSRRDVSSGERDIISTGEDEALYVHETKTRLDLSRYVDSHYFGFDRVFHEHHGNEEVYEGTAAPLVNALFAGWRCTCFAYGQTGTGKTYTMEGSPGNPGLYLLAVSDIFERKRLLEKDVGVFISFFEIYGSRLHDLLNAREIVQCREDGMNEVRIQGLTERRCEDVEEVMDVIALAARERSTGVTGANDDSSRSHAVFQIELRAFADGAVGRASSGSSDAGCAGNHFGAFDVDSDLHGPAGSGTETEEIGRLSFIDLAGSERGTDTASANVQTRREGAEINKSLLALKECIRAMDQRSYHTPFRGSKLTQVLKASFVGRAKCSTVMIANVSPAGLNVEHTLNTLRYSQRVREMKGGTPEKGSGSGYSSGSGAVTAASSFSYGVPPPRASTARALGNAKGDMSVSSAKADLSQTGKVVGAMVASVGATPRRSTGRLGSAAVTPAKALDRRGATIASSTADRSAVDGRTRGRNSVPLADASGVNDRERVTGDAVGRVVNRTITRRKNVASKSMIPVSSARSRRATLTSATMTTATEEEQLDRAALKLSSRPRKRESIVPADALENTELNTNQHHVASDVALFDGDRLVRTRTTGSGGVGGNLKAEQGARSPADANVEEVEVNESESSGDTRHSQSTLPLDGDENDIDESDLLYSSKPLSNLGLTPAVSGTRSRRMVVPQSARRKQRPRSVDASLSAKESKGGMGLTGDGELLASAKALSAETTKVVALHRQKAEELTKLLRDSVELMHAVEHGRVAPGSYATKLELNLALSMDAIHTLKTQVATLGAQERQ